MCLLPLAALVALPPAACAQQAEPRQPEPRQADSRQGMVVVRDADTGELRAPTPAEAQALHPRTNATAAAAAAPPPRMVIGPGGRRSVQLGDRHMVYSVVTRDADGKLAEQCVHGAHAADHAVKGAPAPGTRHEEQHNERR